MLFFATMRTDVHQHLWSEPLVAALAAREELPFVRREHGLDRAVPGRRASLRDRHRAARRPPAAPRSSSATVSTARSLCLSSPIGIESLPREQASPLLDAYHEGALALGGPFGVWGAVALDRPTPHDVDRALDRGCVGISLPAGALAGGDELAALRSLLARLESAGAPLLVHPGPGLARPRRHRVRASLERAALVAGADRTTSPRCRRPGWRSWPPGAAEHPRLRVDLLDARRPRAAACRAAGARAAAPRPSRPTRCSSTRPPPTARSRSPRWSGRRAAPAALRVGPARRRAGRATARRGARLGPRMRPRSTRRALGAADRIRRRCERCRTPRHAPATRSATRFACVPRPQGARSRRARARDVRRRARRASGAVDRPRPPRPHPARPTRSCCATSS